MLVILVEFTLVPGRAEAFRPLIHENARRSLDGEPGCRRFDVCEDPENASQIVLYEIYDDRAAFEAHLRTAHLRAFEAASAGMVRDKRVRALRLAAA